MSLFAGVFSRHTPLRGLFVSLAGFFVLAFCLAAARHWLDLTRDAEASMAAASHTLAHTTEVTLNDKTVLMQALGRELLQVNALRTPGNGQTLMARQAAGLPGIAALGLLRPDGRIALATIPLPETNLARLPETRDSFRLALSSGRSTLGIPFRLGDTWVTPLWVPVSETGGAPSAVVMLAFPLDGARSLLPATALPAHTTLALVGEAGTVHYLYPLPAGMPEAPDWATLANAHGLATRTPVAGWGLIAQASMPTSAIFNAWLRNLLLPSILLLLFLVVAAFIYRRALRRQRESDDIAARLAGWRQAVLDGAEYSIITTDPQGRIVSFNTAAMLMLGYRPEAVVGRHTPELFHDPEELRLRAEALSQEYFKPASPGFEVIVARARQGESEESEWTYVRKDGSRLPVRVMVSPLKTPNGTIEGFLIIAEDLTERRATEQALDESRQALIERNASLKLINQLSNRIHASLAHDDIVREALDTLVRLTATPHCMLHLLNREGGRLELAGSRGLDTAQLQALHMLPMEGNLCALAVEDKAPQRSEKLADDTRIRTQLRNVFAAGKLVSGIAVPLLYNDQALGVVSVLYTRAHSFKEGELDTLNAYCITLALALANARHLANIEHQATHDSLTGLPNRVVLHSAFKERVRTKNMAALMLLDLDRFKEVNDTLGHHIGDELLTQVGERLKSRLPGRPALVCRLGGDEFAVLLTDVVSQQDAVDSAHSLNTALRESFSVQGIALQIGASIGLALYPDHGSTSHDLLRMADVAMYQAKRTGTGVALYDRALDTYSPERLSLAVELTRAVENGELVMHYQPKLDLATFEVVGFEALVRWQHPRLGLLYPADFVDLVEMNESIHGFTRAVLDCVLTDRKRLDAAGFALPIAFNLSTRNLLDSQFAAYLQAALATRNTPAAAIAIELTETALMQDPDMAVTVLRDIAGLGIKIAVDDFGTGYSSLAYLRRLPLSALKIDQSFVRDMAENAQDAIIVRSTIALAHNLGLYVIAEGAEDDTTVALLREMGCDQVQGYHFSKPLPLAELLDWLATFRPEPVPALSAPPLPPPQQSA